MRLNTGCKRNCVWQREKVRRHLSHLLTTLHQQGDLLDMASKVKKVESKSARRPKPSMWNVVRWRHDTTGDNLIQIDFPVRGGGVGTTELPADRVESPLILRRQLVRKGADLPKDPSKAEERIQWIIDSVPDEPKLIVDRTGWHFDGQAFVLGDRSLGAHGDSVKLSQEAAQKASSKGFSGTLETWQESIGRISLSSSFVSFGIMAALSAPILSKADISEGMFFCLSGGSGQGKTTASRAAATVSGKARGLADWNTTKRNLEELAASHSDLLLVLDDIEKNADGDSEIIKKLSQISHGLPSGQSKGYSRFISGPGQLERLYWNCVGLTSSPFSIEDYVTKQLKRNWTNGQRVRLIDLPISDGENGIFDRLSGTAIEVEARRNRLVGQLEEAIRLNYGTLLPAWIDVLKSVPASEICRLVELFVSKMVPRGTGFDRRFAMKFGLVFAAGYLATKKGLLPWPTRFAQDVTVFCYGQALTAIRGVRQLTEDGIEKLGKLASSSQHFPKLKEGGVIGEELQMKWLGFRRMRQGHWQLAVRRETILQFGGSSAAAQRMVEDFEERELLASGHGGKKAKQIPIRYESEPKARKLRFLVLDYNKAKAAYGW